MKKSIKAGALFVAGVFVLSGCGSSEGDSGSASDETKSASASPTPTAAAQYSADELEAALEAVKADEGWSGPITNDETLRPQLEAVPNALEGITITPAECGELVTANLAEKIDSATVAVLQLSATDAVTILSYEDASFIEEQIENNAKQMESCTDFQMEAGGQVSTATGKTLDAATEAETTEAYSSLVTTAGVEAETIQVTGFSGTTNITVSMTDPADAEGAVAAAEELIDAVLAELESK